MTDDEPTDLDGVDLIALEVARDKEIKRLRAALVEANAVTKTTNPLDENEPPGESALRNRVTTQACVPSDYQTGYRAGVEAAVKVARVMADQIGTDPVTDGGRLMRDTCLDVADTIDELPTPGVENVDAQS